MQQAVTSESQLGLFGPEENPDYITTQLITYIGNKRSLLPFIASAVENVVRRLGKSKIDVVDLFSGSGVVARYLRRYAQRLVANDLERYSEVLNRCYLANASTLDVERLHESFDELTRSLVESDLRPGFISKLYSPRDDENIQPGERVFYTSRNAKYLDTARMLIEGLNPGERPFFLAPLLSEASIHANTSGVFKGFYKDANTGLGRFGGRNSDALKRIMGPIHLPFPVFSRFECEVTVTRNDANDLARTMHAADLVYIDPPYNQHPYGSNYFMLNLLVDYQEPHEISDVSGIPVGWNRSDYNKPQAAEEAFSSLVRDMPASHLLISFNSEGFIRKERMVQILEQVGSVQTMETTYNAFRGSRNLRNRDIHVKEFLFLVEK